MVLIIRDFMIKIGVVFPKEENKQGWLKSFFGKNKYEYIFMEEYGIEFFCVYDNQNCAGIFSKTGVENVVIMTDKAFNGGNVRILNGERMYKKMLPDFVRKTAKRIGGNCTVTVVDKNLTNTGIKLVEDLCSVFETITVCTDKLYDAHRMCDRLLEKLGVVITVAGNDVHITSDIVVVLEDCGNSYGQECIVIDKNCNKNHENYINDFYIPFNVKPPFGMPNLVFAECVEIAVKNTY